MPNYSESERRNFDTIVNFFSDDPNFDLFGAFAEDATWWNGLPLIPGYLGQTEYSGLDAIRQLFAIGQGDLGPGIDPKDPTTINYSDIVMLADGDYVVRQHTEHCRTRSGRAYRNVYCYVFRFDAHGRIKYVTEHWNTWYTYQLMFNKFDIEPAHPEGLVPNELS